MLKGARRVTKRLFIYIGLFSSTLFILGTYLGLNLGWTATSITQCFSQQQDQFIQQFSHIPFDEHISPGNSSFEVPFGDLIFNSSLESDYQYVANVCDLEKEDKADLALVKEWVEIIADWLLPFKPYITAQHIEHSYNNPGDHIIVQYIRGTFYILDEKGLCSNPEPEKEFQKYRCYALFSILRETVSKHGGMGCKLRDFEFVYSFDDLPIYGSQENRTVHKPIPGFGAVRCWQKGFMSFPMFGSHELWDINEMDTKIAKWLKQHPRPFAQRKAAVVFKGGSRGCSFPPEANQMGDWLIDTEKRRFPEFYPAGEPCGRDKLRTIANDTRSVTLINYENAHMTMQEQEDQFRYTIAVEGYGGWTDRLSQLMFYDMGVMVQEHPCKEWYEHLFLPWQHYVPVSNDFSDVLGRVRWAEHHPYAVQKMIRSKISQAKRVLSRRGILTFSMTLWSMYSRRLKYKVGRRRQTLRIDDVLEQFSWRFPRPLSENRRHA